MRSPTVASCSVMIPGICHIISVTDFLVLGGGLRVYPWANTHLLFNLWGGGTGCVHHPPSIYFSLSVLWLCSVLSVCLTVSFSDSETHRLSYDCCVSLSKTVLSTGKAEQEAWKNWENECDGSLLCSSLSHAHVKDVVTFIFDTWKVLSFLGVYSYGIIHLLIFYLLSLSAITSIPFHIRVVCYQRPL